MAYDLFRANTGLWEANLPSKFSTDTLDVSVPGQCAHLCKSIPCGALNVFLLIMRNGVLHGNHDDLGQYVC